jgi:hypothetical protein
MARREFDKEDLLREATALVTRIELALVRAGRVPGVKPQSIEQSRGDAPATPQVAGQAAQVVVGFRQSGAASVYFGSEPVYHFNAADELRRAYCDGLLYKAEGGQLVSLRRERQKGEVQLLRHALSDTEQRAFVERMQQELHSFAAGLEAGAYRVVGQVPEEADVFHRVRSWLSGLDMITIAESPHAERRR